MAKRKPWYRGLGQVLKNSFKSFGEHKLTKLSGSLAYYTVFSMAPLLVVIISLSGIFLGREAVEGEIHQQLAGFVGSDTAAQLQLLIKNASLEGKSTPAAIIGGVVLLVGATTVFAEIQDSINSIWNIKAKPKKGWLKLIKNRMLSFSVIVSLAFLLLVSLAISALIDGLGDRLKAWFPDITVLFFYILNLLLTFVITTVIFAVIFKVLPDAITKWKDVWAGAITTALLFMIGKTLISIYIARADIGNTYGPAGSLVILLLWVYYSSIILYFGAAFTRNYAITHGSVIRPASYAVAERVVIDESRTPITKKDSGH
jgi:membrane protein